MCTAMSKLSNSVLCSSFNKADRSRSFSSRVGKRVATYSSSSAVKRHSCTQTGKSCDQQENLMNRVFPFLQPLMEGYRIRHSLLCSLELFESDRTILLQAKVSLDTRIGCGR
jgi:hypothetical protein